MADMMDRLREVATNRKDVEKKATQQSFEAASRKRLLRILEKKLNTSFIGALSQFETHFGKLWGHGKDEMDCSAEELAWREIWNLCRTDVLNNGNNQLRAVVVELGLYDVAYNGYKLNLPVGNAKQGCVTSRK